MTFGPDDRAAEPALGLTQPCPGLTEAQVDQFVTATCGRRDTHGEHVYADESEWADDGTEDDGEEDEDLDDYTTLASTPAYIAAEHRAQIRTANAGRGVDEIARLVRLGTLPQSSLDAANDELEYAREALGRIHRTPIGQDPQAALIAAAVEALKADKDKRGYDSPLGGCIVSDEDLAEVVRIVLRSAGVIPTPIQVPTHDAAGEPNCQPLRDRLPLEHCDEWMWMGRWTGHGDRVIECYKHINTRRYLSLDQGGQAWHIDLDVSVACTPWCEESHEHIPDPAPTFMPLPFAEALEWALS